MEGILGASQQVGGRRTVIRFADWTITPEPAIEAPPIIFEMQCTTCTEGSDADEDFTTVQQWALEHSGRNPSHTGYREIVHRFWRTFMS